jgi:hypothetical protein
VFRKLSDGSALIKEYVSASVMTQLILSAQ